MAARVRARFYVSEFKKRVIGTEDGKPVLHADVTLNAVTRNTTEDNIDWAKYSPSGQITLSVSQIPGGAYETFESLLGKDVSLVFEEIETQ